MTLNHRPLGLKSNTLMTTSLNRVKDDLILLLMALAIFSKDGCNNVNRLIS